MFPFGSEKWNHSIIKMGKQNILLISPHLSDHMTDKLMVSLMASEKVNRLTVAGIARNKKKLSQEKKIIASFASKKFFSRIPLYPSIFFGIRKLLKNNDIVISWTLDIAFLCALATKFFCKKRKKFILLYSDVHPLCTCNKFYAKIFQAIEKFTAKQANAVAFTSPYFRTEYFGRMLNLDIKNHHSLENKISKDHAQKIFKKYNPDRRDISKIRIGYFGILAYKDTYNFMIKAARCGIYTYFRGRLLSSIAESPAPELNYGGEYKNPDDFPEMFETINMSYIVHDFHPNTNTQWAMSNRFYDALMMKTPIVVQKGTASEKFVLENDIGISIDIYDEEKSIETLCNIKPEDISRWISNISKLDEHCWRLTDEISNLIEKVDLDTV